MKVKRKSILIKFIINTLNDKIKNENKEMCKNNLYSDQKPLYGANMFFDLMSVDDNALKKIATACGL